MSERERELAGYVAPILRSTEECVLRRRVKTYDRETGEVTGEVTMREVVGGLAQATALGLEVVEGVRRSESMCERCGKPVKSRSIRHGPRFCPSGDGGCHRQRVCAGEGCSAVPPRNAFLPSELERRGGRPWKCLGCSMRHGPRSAQTHCAGGCGRKVSAGAFSANKVKRRGGRDWRCMSCASKASANVEAARLARPPMTAAERKRAGEQIRAARAAMTPEQEQRRKDRASAAVRGTTPEQRRERAAKAWATRKSRP